MDGAWSAGASQFPRMHDSCRRIIHPLAGREMFAWLSIGFTDGGLEFARVRAHLYRRL